jgi:hypothetical protein
MGLSFTIIAGPRQRSHSQIRVPRDSDIFYSLRFETPPTWKARSLYLYPPGTGWTQALFSLRRLLRLSGQRWRYSTPPPHEICHWTPVQSQSHIATDGQSVIMTWCRAPSGAHYQIFIIVWQLRSCFLWGGLSDERTCLSFVYAAGPCQSSLSRS